VPAIDFAVVKARPLKRLVVVSLDKARLIAPAQHRHHDLSAGDEGLDMRIAESSRSILISVSTIDGSYPPPTAQYPGRSLPKYPDLFPIKENGGMPPARRRRISKPGNSRPAPSRPPLRQHGAALLTAVAAAIRTPPKKRKVWFGSKGLNLPTEPEASHKPMQGNRWGSQPRSRAGHDIAADFS
jgi:hypothetical protein